MLTTRGVHRATLPSELGTGTALVMHAELKLSTIHSGVRASTSSTFFGRDACDGFSGDVCRAWPRFRHPSPLFCPNVGKSAELGIAGSELDAMASKGGNPDERATDAEIEKAIGALRPADLVRLGKVASFRARALAAAGLGQSGADLLQEAIKRTLAGQRHWRKAIPFVTHLVATMRSIANHALEPPQGAVLVSTAAEDLQQIPGAPKVSDPERLAAVRERLQHIRKHFDDDDEVGLVLEGMAAGMKGIDIQLDLNLTPQQYETIVLRLRRGIDRSEGWAP